MMLKLYQIFGIVVCCMLGFGCITGSSIWALGGHNKPTGPNLYHK